MYTFNVEKATQACVEWLREWFDKNGKGCNAVLGISGGKDSSVAAALCVKALGKERVFGVLMPQGEQHDIQYSYDLCKELGIEYTVINIKGAVDAIYQAIDPSIEITSATRFNLPARIRMSAVYALSQSKNGRVINTCNMSEDWVWYSTRYGDSVGDVSPLSHFTVTEVKAIGRYLGLSEKFIVKPPIDGLCGKTDEDNLGFTYDTLDAYIRQGVLPPQDIKDKIDDMHAKNLFKLRVMDSFEYKADE